MGVDAVEDDVCDYCTGVRFYWEYSVSRVF